MAKAKNIINKTIKLEGGISAHKNDEGRLTYKGISKFYHPTWEGWEIIEDTINELFINVKYKSDRKKLNIELDNNKTLQDLLFKFYLNKFWKKIKGDSILSNSVAKNIFDFAVNSGPKDGAKAAQITSGLTDDDVDGLIGPTSLKYINSKTDIIEFILEFNSIRLHHYINEVDRKPRKQDFLFGWCNRIIELLNDDMDFRKDANVFKIDIESKKELFFKFKSLEEYLSDCWSDEVKVKNLKGFIEDTFQLG